MKVYVVMEESLSDYSIIGVTGIYNSRKAAEKIAHTFDDWETVRAEIEEHEILSIDDLEC